MENGLTTIIKKTEIGTIINDDFPLSIETIVNEYNDFFSLSLSLFSIYPSHSILNDIQDSNFTVELTLSKRQNIFRQKKIVPLSPITNGVLNMGELNGVFPTLDKKVKARIEVYSSTDSRRYKTYLRKELMIDLIGDK